VTDETYTGELESAPTDDPEEIPADEGDLETEDAKADE
jgi:hypothetical protein